MNRVQMIGNPDRNHMADSSAFRTNARNVSGRLEMRFEEIDPDLLPSGYQQ
jgi:hypothetical protein